MFDIAIVDEEFIFLKQFKDNLNEFFSNCDFRLDSFQSSEDNDRLKREYCLRICLSLSL